MGYAILGSWLGGMGHGTTSIRDFERCGARAAGGDRGRPQSAAIGRATCGAGGHRARLGRSARGAAGGATHWRQPADGVAVATTLRRERGRGFVARQDPQARQAAVAGGNHGSGGGLDVHCAAPGDPLDRPGNGQGHRHLGGFGAAHLAGAQTSTAPAAHVQALARSRLCRQAHRHCRAWRLPSGRPSAGPRGSIRPPMRWCCRSMRGARSRRSTAPSRDCRSSPGASNHDA